MDDGKVLSLIFQDKSSKILATAFNELATRLSNSILEGAVY